MGGAGIMQVEDTADCFEALMPAIIHAVVIGEVNCCHTLPTLVHALVINCCCSVLTQCNNNNQNDASATPPNLSAALCDLDL